MPGLGCHPYFIPTIRKKHPVCGGLGRRQAVKILALRAEWKYPIEHPDLRGHEPDPARGRGEAPAGLAPESCVESGAVVGWRGYRETPRPPIVRIGNDTKAVSLEHGVHRSY